MEKKSSLSAQLTLPVEVVARRIYVIRGLRVMLDKDLAELYHVLTKNLNLAVRRNSGRFPEDFMFQLTDQEAEGLRLQIATSNEGRGGRRYLPFAFTELGVAMLSSVLHSDRAMQMNIVIMRAFVQLREVLVTNRALAQKIEQLTTTTKDHAALFDIVIQDIQNLDKKLTGEIRRLKAPRRPRPRMGFHLPDEK